MATTPCPLCALDHSESECVEVIATLTRERDEARAERDAARKDCADLAHMQTELREAMRARTEQAAADLATARASEARLRVALGDAARSLTWIADRRTERNETQSDVLHEQRTYAASRAGVARAALAGAPAAGVLSAAEERVAARAVALLMLRCGLREFVVRRGDLDASPVETTLTSESVPEGVRYTVTGGAPAAGEFVAYVEPGGFGQFDGDPLLDDTIVERHDDEVMVALDSHRFNLPTARALAAALLSAAREGT